MKKAAIALIAMIITVGACGEKKKPEIRPFAEGAEPSGELIIEDLKEGAGMAVQKDMRVSVHYIGTLADGTQFDNSRERGNPLIFTVGIGQVIKGWDQGLIGMKPGGVRKLTIPPHLGYGSQQIGRLIPPNSTLIFEIELLEIFK